MAANLFLYIDPGTGSMLFSILIGAAATLFFLGKAALIKLKVFFSGRKGRGAAELDAAYMPYVIYSEGKQYWNVFKPVVDEFEKRGVPLVYYTSAKDDPIFDGQYTHIKREFIGEGNAAFARLNLLSAGIVLMTTPGLDVYQLKRSRRVQYYANILHGASDATMMRLYALDYFDAVLLTGDYQKKDIRFLEEARDIKKKALITIGCTYLDSLAEKMRSIPDEQNHPFTVLVSPSWGPDALLSKYGEKLLTPLVETGFRIIVRPHPQSKKSESDMLDTLTKKYAGAKNLEWDYNGENIYAMKKSDIMISDFSAIIYDYLFLCDRPVIYVNAGLDLAPYDAYDLPDEGKNIWQFRVIKNAGMELRKEHFTDIKKIIAGASDSEDLRAARREAKAEAWMYEGEAGKNAADFMISTLEKINQETAHEEKSA